MHITRYAVVPVAAAMLALAACGGGTETYDRSGQVVDKQTDEECSAHRSNGRAKTDCDTEYEIILDTTQDTDDEDVDVTHDHYDACEVGEEFPSCTGNGQ